MACFYIEGDKQRVEKKEFYSLRLSPTKVDSDTVMKFIDLQLKESITTEIS
jgi:hypothetical protein